MTNAWAPPSPTPVEQREDHAPVPATNRATTSSAVRGVLVAAALIAIGAGIRVATNQPDSTASNRFPAVTAGLPTEEFLQITFIDPDGIEAIESTMRVSLADPVGIISVTTQSGDVVVSQFREDGTYVKATNTDVWVEREAGAMTENLFGMGRLQAEAFGTFDDIVHPRLQPFVIIVDDEQVVLPIEPIGANSPGSENGVQTRHLVLRLDRTAMAEADPFAEQFSYFPDDGVLSLWVDTNGLVRQQDVSADDESPTLVRLDAVMTSLPELDIDLDAAIVIAIDEPVDTAETGGS